MRKQLTMRAETVRVLHDADLSSARGGSNVTSNAPDMCRTIQGCTATATLWCPTVGCNPGTGTIILDP